MTPLFRKHGRTTENAVLLLRRRVWSLTRRRQSRLESIPKQHRRLPPITSPAKRCLAAVLPAQSAARRETSRPPQKNSLFEHLHFDRHLGTGSLRFDLCLDNRHSTIDIRQSTAQRTPIYCNSQLLLYSYERTVRRPSPTSRQRRLCPDCAFGPTRATLSREPSCCDSNSASRPHCLYD
jgi:hypothetical protein